MVLTDFEEHEGENINNLQYICANYPSKHGNMVCFLSGSNRGIFKRAQAAKLRGSAFEGDFFLCEVGLIEVWNRSRSARESGKNCRYSKEQRTEYHTYANINTTVINK